MKALLGCLMCVVFVISQSSVVAGGFLGGGAGSVTVTGTYAGVLNPIQHVQCDTCGSNTSLNQLGLFSVSIPTTGLGTGTALLFDQGNIYSGTISATGNPDSANVTGIISASFSYIEIVTSTTVSGGQIIVTNTPITVAAEASGKVNTKVKLGSKIFSSLRLTGTADIQFELTVNNPFDEIIFKVVGFKQSS